MPLPGGEWFSINDKQLIKLYLSLSFQNTYEAYNQTRT